MNKLRKGDQVIAISGRDKGKSGVVLRRIDPDHLVVEGINIVKKHVRPNPMKGEQGGIIDKTMPIHQSNLAILNTKTNKADRVAIDLDESGKKQRVFKSDRQPVPSPASA